MAPAQRSSLTADKTWAILIPALVLLCSQIQYSLAASNTLTQGGPAVNSSTVLVSPNGLFTLGFQRLPSGDTYLGIWYNNDTSLFFWVANPDFPIPNSSSGELALDHNGTLKLAYSGGPGPIVLYSSNRQRRRLSAVLQDTGCFSLFDPDADAPGNPLWQSFDSPTNSWLPGMKLGVVDGGPNRKLTSWLTNFNPARGAFTLEWDPTDGKEELVMRRRGVPFWTSGKQLGPNMFRNRDLTGMTLDLNVTRVSNPPDDDYLTFTASTNDNSFRDERNFTMWRLHYEGTLNDQSSGHRIIYPDICDGNNTEDGCVRWPGPDCRSHYRVIVQPGLFKNSQVKLENNGSLGISDCVDICWRDCDCGGTTVIGGVPGNGTGCVFHYGQFVSSRRAGVYRVIIRDADGRSDADPSERLLAELTSSDPPIVIDEMGVDDDPGHNLKVFSVASIMTSTNNFSLQNKLGEGGFGPVYKGKLGEGSEVAVKRLSKKSTQGLVQFKNELILIAKLQHRNLVRLLGYCIHEEEMMLVGYMSPEYAMDGTFSTKSDVFSFGVMLLEIVSGMKNYGLIQLDPPINLVEYAWKLWNEGTPLQLVDAILTDSNSCKDQILRCINVGLLCIEYNAYDRPEIVEVISMLTREIAQLPTPKHPALTMMRPGSVSTERSSSTNNREICSTNEVTTTMMSGR
ncbi:unnamed protein product [Linum tenue]|uniref:Non-specific serine/threonine protein kinase n=1 Tax=Linum tenue TaxID=586396 RepID=A0AAV0NFZ5_9ROSI|nr:unnamed protein product [Linum tenue]